MPSDKFKFRKHASIGAAAAEEDGEFLSECFVETGDLSTLADCSNPRRIVLGRTGTGKTALLNCLAEQTNAIVVKPESLSFNYLANSTILQFFVVAGVKLDLFFKLLWRHVFTVELLKKRYNITNEDKKRSFLERIKSIITPDKKKERAVAYLLKWGETFWEPTEYRIKEITSKIENQLKDSVGTRYTPLVADVSNASKLSAEEKAQIVYRGQEVINSIQMRELTDILDFLNEDVFADEKQSYYVCVDRLDEDWIDDRFRYLLIRSLIETLRDFIRVRSVKLIVALRDDLLARVFRLTRDAGFQEEKYRSLYLPLRWGEQELKQLLDKRVNYLVRQTYTRKTVGYKDLLLPRVGDESAIDYMLKRTLLRPRELIEFFNNCIEQAEGRPTINKKMLLAAEGAYSKDRLRSLQDEWYADYSRLADFILILRKKPKTFKVASLDKKEVEEFCLDYSTANYDCCGDDILSTFAKNLAEGKIDVGVFIRFLFHVLYRTGVVGLKTQSYERTQWFHHEPSPIAAQTIDETTAVSIHPMFWRVLGIKP